MNKFLNTKIGVNQKESKMPSLTMNSFEKFPAQFDKYYNNNLPFRDVAGRAWSTLNYSVFQTSANRGVLLGKSDNGGRDRWIFYMNSDDFNPVRNTQGDLKYSKQLMEDSLKVINENTDSLKKRGIELLYLIAPNKETIYKEKLPESVEIYSEKTRTDDLIEYLVKDNDVDNLIYPKDELLKAKEQHQIYWRQDTHWNEVGAGVAFRVILEKFRIDYRYEDAISFRDGEYDEDLTKMINMEGFFEDKAPMVDIGAGSDDYIVSYDSDKKGVIVSSNNSAVVRKNILIVGDSYRDALSNYCYRVFKKCIILHRNDYDASLLDKYKIDLVVSEFVERYIPKIRDQDL